MSADLSLYTVSQLEAELLRRKQATEEEKKRLEREYRSVAKKPKYAFETHVDTLGGFLRENPNLTGSETVRLLRVCTNTDELKAQAIEYNQPISVPESLRSVEYYRFHGVLLRNSGGYLLLKTPLLCSDEQWEALKRGEVPAEFLNPHCV